MEKNVDDKHVAVHLKINFCIYDPTVLKEEFLKIKGVAPVIAVEKKNMMILFTKIHPMTLLEMIKEMGVNAEMFNPIGHDVVDDDNKSTSTRNYKTSKESNTKTAKKLPHDCTHETNKETSEYNDNRSGYDSIDGKATKYGSKPRHDKKIEVGHVCESFEETSKDNDDRSEYDSIDDKATMCGRKPHRGKKIEVGNVCESFEETSGYNSIDDKATRNERKPRCGKKIEREHACESFEIPLKVDILGKKKDDHVYESYEKPTINKQICRDFYCKSHAQRGIIHSELPSIDSEDHPCHTIGFLNRFGRERNPMFEDNVPFEYFPQRNMPEFPCYDSYPTSIMHRNAYSRMAMPLTGYDDYEHNYSRQVMPLSRYDAYMFCPTRRPIPRYDDEHVFSAWGMPPFSRCGNQYR